MLPFAFLVVVTVAQASVRCDDARRVMPKQVQRAAQILKADLAKKKLAPADLPGEGAAAWRLLEAQIRTHAWCGADAQMLIVRRAMHDVTGQKKTAPAKAPQRPAEASPSAFAPTEDLPDKEVATGCPGFAKGRPFSVPQAIDQLGATLERTQVRAIEVRRGPSLADQLEQAVRMHDNPRAVKTACVLTYRASLVTDDLDRVMARFQRVNVLRDKNGLSDAEKLKFDALVNDASDQVAHRDYPGARGTLETLLVFMGDPARPSESLPRP